MSSDLQNSPTSPDFPSEGLWGTVLAVQANYYQVKLDSKQDAVNKEIKHPLENLIPQTSNLQPSPYYLTSDTLLCTRRSRLKKLGQGVMVGDRVEIEEPDWQGGRGAISAVSPRQSELDRPPIANTNQILLVFAMAEPTLDPHQLTRFLIKAESSQLPICLCFSKADLASAEEQTYWKERIQQWGYQPRFISLHQQTGLTALFDQLRDRITVVSGPSGVGKSSLINHLIPLVKLRVGEVSGKLARGRHTTRHVELFDLPAGGLLADTPGFNQPDLNCHPKDLVDYFPEARQRLAEASCQFSNCLHQEEPGCVVRGNWERYEFYLEMLQEAIARHHALDRQSHGETNLKLKNHHQGNLTYEPKLEPKKYRQISRRTQQHQLQVLQDDELELD
ncbi:small ribosomal subunit biogenesis GTPase RsgA [Phormidium sp. CLA17]|uniref:small ribosomal subunit biogenesis GTPase RsgA n=1 Tax=Leptolyngbya sp. Cla-17 TaxID=2803751 RepID=UPI001490FAC9|nr:small ribosomal subunit biogenesis GTPase RsgA [Leptolyngbya sp. Cla-17]MBM0740437.1 small ribosomal subunit biogenesis GTPase RsgA [Leptolyngbya sp. Cla-17]